MVLGLEELRTVFEFFTLVGIYAAAILAYRIGIKQNKINALALNLNDFTEIFALPQQVAIQNEKGQAVLVGWNVAIKNAASIPIYINEYAFDGKTEKIGRSVIPTGLNDWYYIPISSEQSKKGNFILNIIFEDYLGRKYSTYCQGILVNGLWHVKTQKRLKL